MLATKLADRGLLEKALSYLEHLAVVIVQNPSIIQPSLVDSVCKLGDRLKYYDIADDPDESTNYSTDILSNRPDNSWLKDLRLIQKEYKVSCIRSYFLRLLNECVFRVV